PPVADSQFPGVGWPGRQWRRGAERSLSLQDLRRKGNADRNRGGGPMIKRLIASIAGRASKGQMAKMSLPSGICLLSLLFLLWSPAFAAFEDTGTGARGVALGDNYVCMGDDVLSLMYNPAELARVQQKEISTE